MEFVYLPQFVKKLKILAKKYPSLQDDFTKLLALLNAKPDMGIPLGNDCFKIRLAIKSKAKGKSGGARVITCLKIEQGRLFFLTVYDKAEQESLLDKELAVLIAYVSQSHT